MAVLRVLLMVLMMVLMPATVAADAVRYVSDELVIVVRNGASSSAGVLTSVGSGTRMELLESDAASGYGRVRLDDGRIGWVQERYLSTRAPARQRAEATEKKLAVAEAELKTLRDEHARLQKELAQLSEGRAPPPPAELIGELEQLRASNQQLQQQNEALGATDEKSRERQRTLLLGGALVAGGFILAWLLRWLWPKRRWGEL